MPTTKSFQLISKVLNLANECTVITLNNKADIKEIGTDHNQLIYGRIHTL